MAAGSGAAQSGGSTAVLEVLTCRKEADGRWAASDDPRHWNYWRREAHVYESGLARHWQPYGIRAARLLARVDRPDGDIALWLEGVPGEPATAWPLARHIEHARRLGAAHGAGEPACRLGVCVSAVKYDWLTALMLARAGDQQLDYGGAGTVSPELRYRGRGKALAFLAGWAAEARALAPLLGFPEAPSGR
ncbi:hypothetical protein ACWDV7_18965 [Streptomyces sp. NPDC003362]